MIGRPAGTYDWNDDDKKSPRTPYGVIKNIPRTYKHSDTDDNGSPRANAFIDRFRYFF